MSGESVSPSFPSSSLRSLLRKTYLFTFLRGWAVWMSYPAQAVLTAVGWVVPVFFYFLLAGYLTSSSTSSPFAGNPAGYVAFFVVGLAFQGFVTNLYGFLAQRIRNEQMMGTLEHVFLSPTSPGAVLAYSSLFGIVLNVTATIVILGVGWGVLGVHLAVNLPTVVLATVLLAVSSTGLGLVAAAFIMWTKQGNPVATFFTLFTQFFAGVLFPVSVLPGAVQFLAYSVPLTFGLNALRSGLLQGGSVVSNAAPLLWMAVYALVSVPLGLFLFHATLRRTKVDGTIATY